jgi:hypothetical protein
MPVKHLYLVAAAAIIGCAPGSGASDTSRTPVVPRGSNLLAADEIVAAHADITTAYDALARLRPAWLRARGVISTDPRTNEFATVFVDGEQYGSLDSLNNIPALQVAYIRYYNVTEAGARFGFRGGTGGVIEVTTK